MVFLFVCTIADVRKPGTCAFIPLPLILMTSPLSHHIHHRIYHHHTRRTEIACLFRLRRLLGVDGAAVLLYGQRCTTHSRTYFHNLPLIFLHFFLCFDVTCLNHHHDTLLCCPNFFSIFLLLFLPFFSLFVPPGVETIGATLGVPDVIMGLTFLAAGTSVPDMLAAVIGE